MRGKHWITLSLALVFGGTLSGFMTAAAQTAPQTGAGKTVLDGVFTPEQAARGLDAYTAKCARCHAENLRGNGAPLTDQKFLERFREDKVDLVFHTIKDSMPRGAAGSLSDGEYTDIVAYILQENGFPSGAAELTADTLPAIQLVGMDGPKPVPNLVVVQVVGCLSSAPNDVWNLNNGSEPVRARRSDEASPEDLKSGETISLGAHTFRLNLNTLTNPFDPAPHSGHKMFIKGVLNRQATGERLNVTAIGMLAERCGQ